MPYIRQIRRKVYDKEIERLLRRLLPPSDSACVTPPSAGEMNYCISRLVAAVFKRWRSYEVANSLLGVLIAVAFEFYRRGVVKYEDEKIAANGDIPGYE